jgi:two-component system sensor histidine kinase PhoQ
VLQGVSEVIAQRPQDLEQARVLQGQIERMSQQISYQLQRASLRKSGLVRHREPLWPVVDSLASTLDKVYRDKRVRLTMEIATDALVPMERNALLEMLGNLMENAYRLCLSQVRVSLRDGDQGLELYIEDDGPGVPPDQRARILQRGERLDRQNPGQGIGQGHHRELRRTAQTGRFELGRCVVQGTLQSHLIDDSWRFSA